MKILTLLIIGMLAGSGSVLAKTVEAPSTIESVVVFPDRALVTRKATLQLSLGEHVIRLGKLPGTIEQDSISAKGEGTAKVKLYGAKLEQRELAKPHSAEVRKLVSQLQELKIQKQELLDKKTVLKKKEDFLGSIEAASSDQVGKDLITKQPSVNDVVEISEFLDKQFSQLFEERRNADVALLEVKDQYDQVQRELKRLHGSQKKQQTDILVDIEVVKPGDFTLEVTYRLPGATWKPVYEARTESDASNITFTSYGLVRQKTGEDWTNAVIFLSTAKPSIGGRVPEMEPWFLRKREPVYYPQAPTAKAKKRMAMRSYDENVAYSTMEVKQEPALAYEAESVQALISRQGPSVVFQLPRKETLLSDWQPRKVTITSNKLSAEFLYQVSPKLSPYAFLTAEVTNSTESLFLSGPVQIFLDSAFVGKSSIDLIAPGEEFTLSLGIDEQVQVERKQLSKKVDVSVLPGFHGKTKSIDFKYLITLENFRPSSIKVKLVDQLPVSDNDEIKIKKIVFDPMPDEEVEDKPGVMHWLFTLKSQGKKEIEIAFRVSHPVNFIVEGL